MLVFVPYINLFVSFYNTNGEARYCHSSPLILFVHFFIKKKALIVKQFHLHTLINQLTFTKSQHIQIFAHNCSLQNYQGKRKLYITCNFVYRLKSKRSLSLKFIKFVTLNMLIVSSNVNDIEYVNN